MPLSSRGLAIHAATGHPRDLDNRPGRCLSFGPLEENEAVALPVAGDLHVRVTHCERVEDTLPPLLTELSARLTSAQGPLGPPR